MKLVQQSDYQSQINNASHISLVVQKNMYFPMTILSNHGTNFSSEYYNAPADFNFDEDIVI